MTESEQRAPPQSVVQASGQVATDVVAGLKGQPILLAMVILNIMAVGIGAWFVDRGLDRASQNVALVLKACLPGGPH